MSNFENIIFDFDGTLVDSQADIKDSLITAIYNIKTVSIDSSSLKIGPPLEEMIKTILINVSQEETKKIVNSFRTIYSESGFNKTFCYGGIENLLKIFKKTNKRIYIATNKPEYLTKKIIKKLNIDFFDDICTVDIIEGVFLLKKEMISLLIQKNKLNRKTTLMIGDSASDVSSGIENGIATIGVGYGYESKEQIMKANPDFYFDTTLQLIDFLIYQPN
ncbi:MAG: HAD family hydrolase [Bacteroidales bacterium]|jgi:phosphoglycolate phosphatase